MDVEKRKNMGNDLSRQGGGPYGPEWSKGALGFLFIEKAVGLAVAEKLGNGNFDPIMVKPGTMGWMLQIAKLTPGMDSGGQMHVGYAVCLKLGQATTAGRPRGIEGGFERFLRERMLDRRKCSGGPGTRKPVSLHLDDLSEVDCLCRLFGALRVVLLASACFVHWAGQLTRRLRLKIGNRKHPKNPRSKFSLCFPSVLMCSETVAISVCQKRTPKSLLHDCVSAHAGPTVNSSPSSSMAYSVALAGVVVLMADAALCQSWWARMGC
ncbi:hypothetical protein CRG98_042285 [Punica granatum]|uniref:Uncharacterized protein n=1 Tax=Punica granatum TaxID=22663 RepID=A0A2I0I0F8_PUNGR|nr:hypothetical protein CRG98_042285 [Punica granatum]